MSEDYRDLPTSKAVIRGKMLVAWFAEATPPVLWRWPAKELASGFALRQTADAKVELLRYDGGITPQVIGVFPSAESAEQALGRVSRSLLSYQATWKKVTTWTASIITLLAIIVGLNLLYHYAELKSATLAYGHSAGIDPSALTRGLDLNQRYVPGTLARAPLPSQLTDTTKKTAPPAGAPVDVDSFYH